MRLRAVLSGSQSMVAAVLLAVTSVAVDPLGLYPFGPLRWALISSGLMLALACWLLQEELVIPRVPALAWVGVLAWGVVCALSGLDPLHAFIGTPDRRWGWVTVALVAAAFLVGFGSAPHRLVKGGIVGLAGVGLYAASQLWGWEPIALTTGSVRVGGPFGSPAYLAAYCVLLLPPALATATNRQQSGGWRILAAGASVLGLAALLGSQTRAGLLGLAAGLLFLLPWLLRGRSRWWLPAGAAALIAVVTVTAAGARLGEALDPQSAPVQARLAEWEVGWRVLATRPLVGVGPEGYRIAFPLAVDESYEQAYGRRVIPDRAHNGAIDTGLALGLPGLAAYVVAAGWLMIRAGWAALAGHGPVAGLGAGVAGYLVQQQFLFPVAEIDPWFWLLAGALAGATATRSAEIRTRGRPWLAGVAGAAALLLAAAGILEVRSDRLLLRAYQSEPVEAAGIAWQAAGLRPDSIRGWLAVADLQGRAGDPSGALEAIDRALRLSPGDPALRAARVELLTAAARASGDPAQLQQALRAYADLLTTDPLNAQHHLAYGNLLARAGDFTRAEQEWRRAGQLAPGSAVPAINLSRLYLQLERPGDAAAAYQQAVAIDPEAPGLDELAQLLRQSGVEIP